MKKVIILFVLTPIISFSQTYYDSALNIHNEVRNYYDLKPLSYDSDLSLKAQEWAEYIASTDSFEVSDDEYGENIFANLLVAFLRFLIIIFFITSSQIVSINSFLFIKSLFFKFTVN